MLKSVAVENYRGFQKYTLGGLSRINLLVGKNNGGKTALLECVHLLAAGGDPSVLIGIASRRGEITSGSPDESSFVDISHFFHGHIVGGDSQFSIRSDNGLPPVTMRVVPLSQIEGTPELFDVSRTRRPAFAMSIECGGSRWKGTGPLFLSSEGTILVDPRRPSRRYFKEEPSVPPPIQFITPDSLELRQLAAIWNQILLESRESEVIEAMRILDPQIASIVFLTGDPQSFRSYGGRAGVVVSFKGDNRRVPLGSCGDGMRRLLALSAALIQAKHGFLIIDEMDTGFHYSIMGDVWSLVARTAIELDIQVFATTHSFDCVRGLAAVCRQDQAIRTQVSLHKIERRLEAGVPFSGEELITADERQLEVR